MNDSNRGETDTPPAPPPAPSPPAPPSERPPVTRRHKVLAVVLSTIGVLIVVVLVAGFLIHLPYVIISPGDATPLDKQVVKIDGAQTYGHSGNVLFLTVRVSDHDPTVWRLVTSWLSSDRDVEKRQTVVGCLSDAENAVINARLMQQSQDDAKYVALTRLGYTVSADPPESVVTEACPGVPANGKLMAGDQVLAIDDQAVNQLSDVSKLVQQHEPGDSIDVTYSRSGTTKATKIVLGELVANGTKCVKVQHVTNGTSCMGVEMQPFVSYHFPIDVTINTQRVGGPSAGLAFTLAIIDDLTPGDLTGGRRVAVTGTIASNGEVGPVGGVEQKAITARQNGVSLMIVPRAELKDARSGAGSVRVVGVDNIDQALSALQKAGGTAVPPASSVAARS